jgi:hypothetical protein
MSSLPPGRLTGFPRLVSIRMAPRPELYRATTTDSNITRTAIPSCRHVSTEGRSLSRVEKFQKLMRADGAVAAKGRSHLAYGNIARGVRHGAV